VDPIYWIDTGVLVQAHRGPYKRSRFPQFWGFLDEQMAAGRIKMPRLAFEEIFKGGHEDALTSWCKPRKGNGLCQNETRAVQERYGQITEHVYDKYKAKPQQVREFLSGADGWVIAYALATSGVVVTMENERSYRSKIKLPTVARVFDVRCRTTYEMLEDLGADFSE
jgi:hypothetical protein